MMTDDQRKHLELIQTVIARLAGNSSLAKGWSITLVSVLLAWSLKQPAWQHSCIALLPLILFWGLDAYFLRQERLFREHYEKVRVDVLTTGKTAHPFSMNTEGVSDRVGSWLTVAFTNPLLAFHGTLFLLTVASIIFGSKI